MTFSNAVEFEVFSTMIRVNLSFLNGLPLMSDDSDTVGNPAAQTTQFISTIVKTKAKI